MTTAKLIWNGDKLIALAKKAARQTLVSISADIVRDAKRYAPVGVAGAGRRGIDATAPVEAGGMMTAQVGFTQAAEYMQWVELGRKPGKPPPTKALLLWVERVLGAGRKAGRDKGQAGTRRGRGSRRMTGGGREQEIKSVAFLVARAIGKRGIKPRRMIGRAADTHAGQMPALFAHKFAEAISLAGLIHK